MLKTSCLTLLYGLAIACAGPMGGIHGKSSQMVAVYPCSAELQAVLDQSGMPVHGSNLPQNARSTRRFCPVENGCFSLQGLPPGRYYVESPPLYLPGDSSEIDRIFASGGCVYFSHRRSQIVEVVADQSVEVDLTEANKPIP